MIQKRPADGHHDLGAARDSISSELLEEWWQRCTTHFGNYHSFAVSLALPTDEEAIRYLGDFAGELDVLSAEHCLLLYFGSDRIRRFGVDDDFRRAAQQHARSRRSTRIGRAFGIDFEDMPCMLFFRDPRSTDHVGVKLKGLSAPEISVRMRGLFSAIDQAVHEKRNVLHALRSTEVVATFARRGAGAAGKIGGIGMSYFFQR